MESIDDLPVRDAPKFHSPAATQRRKPRLIVAGKGRHGKDTVCELLREHFAMSFTSSSEACNEIVMFPLLKQKYGYATARECFDDRANHRAEWYDAIAEYNGGCASRLSREIFAKYDVYCGIRSRDEFLAAKKEGLFDLAVWVQADARVGAGSETSASITLTQADCDMVLDNNGTPGDLVRLIPLVVLEADRRVYAQSLGPRRDLTC